MKHSVPQWTGRSSKNNARKKVLDHVKGPLKTAMWLPGRDMLDVRVAYQMGIISYDTFNIFVERDRHIASAIEAQLQGPLKYKIGGILHDRELSVLNLPAALGWHKQLEFVNLDLCGLINRPEARFLFDLADSDVLAEDAVVSVTTYASWRNCRFGKQDYIAHRAKWLPAMEDDLDELRVRASEFGHSNRGSFPHILRTLEIIQGCLWRYKFKLLDVIVYRDSSDMSVFLMKRVRCSDPQRAYVRRKCFSRLLDVHGYSPHSPEMLNDKRARIEDLIATVSRS
jgi:hypothetical protein